MRRVRHTTGTRRVRRGVKPWTPEEMTTLRRMYRTKSSAEIARMLRRSAGSVQAKARALGLRKPKTWRAAPMTRRKPGRRRKTRHYR